nr:beta-1,4-galactosyltransferase 5-like [Lytechinus pictus]
MFLTRIKYAVFIVLICSVVGYTISLVFNSSVVNDEILPRYVEVWSQQLREKVGLSLRPTHDPFFNTKKPECREHNISGQVGRVKPDLNAIPVAHTEEIVFGHLVGEVRTAVKVANEMLRKKLVDDKTGNKTDTDWHFNELLKPEIKTNDSYRYLPGGHWKPINCSPKWKVAILIPFRDRFFHLPILLRYLIPMLKKQLLQFSFFVIEQANKNLFNRAMLMNVGFLESLKIFDYDCFVIHDVDHVPLDDRNYYGCTDMPRHFLSGVDKWKYKLLYKTFFGAVTGLTKGNIRSINGFPNVYWGWGGEDDDIWKRVKDVGLNITRYEGPVYHYDVIRHHHKSAPLAKDRFELLRKSHDRLKKDGLSNIVYPSPVYELHTLYTNISVDIHRI